MGGAFGAIAEGPSSLLWNPAGLGMPARTEVNLNYVALFEGSNLSEVSASHSFAKSFGIGADIIRFSLPGITMRDTANNITGETADNRTALVIGAGYQATNKTRFGLAAKMINQEIGGVSGSALDFDIGAQTIINRFRFGVQLQNMLTAGISRSGGEENLPRGIRVSAAVKVFNPVLVVVDVVNNNPGYTELRSGIEYSPIELCALRAGWDGNFLTLGGGVMYHDIGFDYAVIKHDILGFSHRISFRYVFGVSDKTKSTSKENVP